MWRWAGWRARRESEVGIDVDAIYTCAVDRSLLIVCYGISWCAFANACRTVGVTNRSSWVIGGPEQVINPNIFDTSANADI